MRTLLISIIGLLLGGATGASARPFSEGCKWSYCYWNEHEGDKFFKYELKEAYELNGKTYNRLYQTVADAYWNIGEELPVFGLRESNGRVYADYDEVANYANGTYLHSSYTVTEDGEVLLYDFNMSKGDTAAVHDDVLSSYIYDAKSIALNGGDERTVFELHCMHDLGGGESFDVFHATVISGIGAQYGDGGLLGYLYFGETLICAHDEFLNVYVEDGRVVYTAPAEPEADGNRNLARMAYHADPFFGDLVTGIKDVKPGLGANRPEAVYDLGGRRMTGALKPGVYIRGGKKIVIK